MSEQLWEARGRVQRAPDVDPLSDAVIALINEVLKLRADVERLKARRKTTSGAISPYDLGALGRDKR